MDFVEQLKSSVDIVKVVGEYVRLRKAGAAPRYTGLCPFHTEKTPSFSVHATHQFYKCFGCGAGGDVIKFVMEVERLTFYEALKLLAERNGVPMPKRAEYSDPESKLRGALYDMHALAARLFREYLLGPGGSEARAYLGRRAVKESAAEEFGLGLSDRSGQMLVRAFEKAGYGAELMEASGLALKRQDGSGWFDRFRGRLMFPIQNESGKIIAFGGRALAPGDEPKYLNSPETPIYRKSHVLYNLHRAKENIRKAERSILVEGYMDAIGVFEAGVREVVASCGTALTSSQIRALKRHSERIVVNFDPDAAGAGAAERSIQTLLEEGMHVRIVSLDGGLDPDEYVKQRGAEAYREKVEGAQGYFHWLADRARARFDMREAEGRVAAFQFLLPAIQKLSDKIERAAVANDVASYLGVETGVVLEQFRRSAIERRDRPASAPPRPEVRAVEKFLLHSLLASEEIRAEILPQLRSMPAVQRFSTRRIFETLFALVDNQPRFLLAELEARLEESDRALLSSVVFADESSEETVTLEQAVSCLHRLEAEERQLRKNGIRARIKEAERAGDMAEALRLAGELDRLERG